MPISPRQKKLLKWAGYPLLALLSFVFALAYTFPYDRLKDKIVEALSVKYDASILAIEPSLVPGTFVIEMMVLRTRPVNRDEKPTIMIIDELEVNIGVASAALWALGMGDIVVALDAKIAGGNVTAKISHNKDNNTVSLSAHTSMLPITSVPGVRDAVGLPMTGQLSADFNLSLPQSKWSKAEGTIEFHCVNCTVGDGVAKLKMKPLPGSKNSRRARRRQLFAGDGLTIPRINLGAMLAQIDIKKGVGTIEKFSAKSKDGFMDIEGKILFKDPFKETLFPGCMSFGFSDELSEKYPMFVSIESMLGEKARQDDGSYALPTKGKLVALRFDPRHKCRKKGATVSRVPERVRPRITTTSKPIRKKANADTAKPSSVSPGASAAESRRLERDKSTASGPSLGVKFDDVKKRARALKEKERLRDNSEHSGGRDADEAGEDEGGADEGGVDEERLQGDRADDASDGETSGESRIID